MEPERMKEEDSKESSKVHFNHREAMVLVEEVTFNEDVLYGKLRGPGGEATGVTIATKEKKWNDILLKVNAVSSTPKTVSQIKKKMANIRQRGKYKRDMAHKTGGGPKPPSPKGPEKLWLDHATTKPGVVSLQTGLDTDNSSAQTDPIGPSGDNKTSTSSSTEPTATTRQIDTEDVQSQQFRAKKRSSKQRMEELEFKNLELENEHIIKKIQKLNAETLKLQTETRCLVLKEMKLTFELNKMAESPSSVNILKGFQPPISFPLKKVKVN